MLLPLNLVCPRDWTHSPWKRDHHADALCQPVELEPVISAELMLQAGACRRHADTLVQCRQRIFRQADAVVSDLDPQLFVVVTCGDVDVACAGLPGDAVLDRVLDQRLQQQRRYQRIERLGLDVVADHQAVGETRTLDFEVLAEEIELRVERHFLLAKPLEREAQ